MDRKSTANIGIRTGDDIIVLDVDGPVGESTLARLQSELGPLPDSREGKTGKGRHLYFKKSPQVKITNSKPSDWKNLDVRGDGAYVVAPGSLHYSGLNILLWIHLNLLPSCLKNGLRS